MRGRRKGRRTSVHWYNQASPRVSSFAYDAYSKLHQIYSCHTIMAKHTAAPVLLLIACLLAATAQCRIIDGGNAQKTNVPSGSCVYQDDASTCKSDKLCYCCLPSDFCYVTMDVCKSKCKGYLPAQK
uniref:Uncharacterized protein n=1 Tax=Avena sativa TaxID=4498 RepID=A0ACD5Z8M6_AVESA